jgi:hypothetical protein
MRITVARATPCKIDLDALPNFPSMGSRRAPHDPLPISTLEDNLQLLKTCWMQVVDARPSLEQPMSEQEGGKGPELP